MNATRLEFVCGLGAATSLAVVQRLFAKADSDFDENQIVLLADIHAGVDNKCSVAREKFTATVAEILKMRPLPRHVLVFGDVAYLYGLGADYDFSRPLFRLMEDAGIVVTIGMGNHDRRSEYAERWPEAAAKSLVAGRYVHLIETSYVGFLMLDTLQGGDARGLKDKGPVAGVLFDDQQFFLKEFLMRRRKPVILCAHHRSSELKVNGRSLDDLIQKSPCIVGFIHGHNHRWQRDWCRDELSRPPHRAKRKLCLPSNGLWGDIGYAICRVFPHRAVVEPVLKDFWIPRPVPNVQRPPEWDEILAEGRSSGHCVFCY